MRARAVALLSFLAVVTTSTADAQRAAAPVIVSVRGTKAVRVQVTSSTGTCEAAGNRSLYDGTLGPGETAQASTDQLCVCERHAPVSPKARWSRARTVCRPTSCKGKICKAASDPTIRVDIATSGK